MAVDQVLTWPNAEDEAKHLCRLVLVDGAAPNRVGRETAPGDDFAAPCIRVERVAGEINRDRTQDAPQIEFASFGKDYTQAQAMSMTIERLLAAHVGERIKDAVLDRFEMVSGPKRPAWGDNARRDIVTWRLVWRPVVTREEP